MTFSLTIMVAPVRRSWRTAWPPCVLVGEQSSPEVDKFAGHVLMRRSFVSFSSEQPQIIAGVMSGLTCVSQAYGAISQSRCSIRWGKWVWCRLVGRLLNVAASLSVFVSEKWRKSAFTGLVRLHSDIRCPKTACSTVGVRTGNEKWRSMMWGKAYRPERHFKEYNGMSRSRTYNARSSRKHTLCVGTCFKWVHRGFRCGVLLVWKGN